MIEIGWWIFEFWYQNLTQDKSNFRIYGGRFGGIMLWSMDAGHKYDMNKYGDTTNYQKTGHMNMTI